MEYKQEDYLHLIKRSINKINELKEELEIEKRNQEDIAIVGMSCRFPGECQTPENFWEFIVNGGDGVIEVPKNRWDSEEYYSPHPNSFGKMYLKEAGFLQQNIGEFDALFFGISPREAVEMDPQQRLLLEVSWEALERAGIAANQLKGTQTGVFMGVIGSEYALLPRTNKDINPYILTGSMANIVSGRLSYILGLHGPSISIDTACSSSLVSVHLACQSLQRGESNLALAGGVNLMISPQGFVSLCELNALAKDGRCKTFDSSGDGYGRGEGCGVVVLKRLSDAVKDNDKILAVIRGTGINQDGPSSGLTVPNGSAQKDLICKTLEKANLVPNDISYFELHGTGTSLGDPIEFQALSEIFSENNREKPLILGSVKSNIGHLEGASGIASLIKSVLCLQNKKIPPNLHLKNVNSRINLKKIPAVFLSEAKSWEASEKSRIMGISSFGFSGTNAHLILAEAPEEKEVNRDVSNTLERPLHILALSAKSENALIQLVDKYRSYFENENEEKLEDICFTANSGRSHFAHRATFIAENLEVMKARLSEYLDSNSKEAPVQSMVKEKNKLVFLFNGKINKEIAIYLFETQPTFKKVLLSCDKKFQELVNISFLENIKAYSINEFNNTLGYINKIISFSLQFSLLKMWENWGIRPSAATGCEEGEFTAACAAGIMTMETAMIYILENENINMKTNVDKCLNKPHIRVISGAKGKVIENQEAISNAYWQNIFSNKPQISDRIKNLIQQGYKNFLEIGLINNSEDILSSLDNQYFYFSIDIKPWECLMNTIAKLYSLGFDINWGGLDENYVRHKVILPTYQFQRKYFWCDTMPFGDYLYVKTKRSKGKKDCNNFLDGKINKSPFKEKQIEYSLSLDIVPELADTEGVVHVGYFLEFLGRAIKKIYNSGFSVKYIEFLSPLMVMDNKTTDVSLILNSIDNEEVEFSFYSSQGNDNWSNTTKGIAKLEKIASTEVVFSDFKTDIKSRCNECYSSVNFYQKIQERGIFLGKSVQWIDNVWSREGEALAKFREPEGLEIFSNYEMNIHPGVFDACAQLFHAALPKYIDENMKYMVSKWENFILNKELKLEELWCHVILDNNIEQSNNLTGIFRIYNQDGILVSQISSGLMKGLSKERENRFKKFLQPSEGSTEIERQSELLNNLKNSSLDKWEEIIRNYLHELFALILKMEVPELDIDESLMNLGLDSLVGVEAKINIERDLSIFLPIEMLIEGPSINELTKSIIPLISIEQSDLDVIKEDSTEKEYKMDINSWIVHRKSNTNAKIKLFCFPYGSGGGASLYRKWQEELPDFIEVCPIQLPGKENRIKEKAFNNIDTAVEILKEVIAPELDRPYAFYGHSMGALIAYRLAYQLWKDVDNKPKHLFVGAYSSPTIIPNPLISFIRKKFKEAEYTDIPKPDILSSITSQEFEKILNVITSEADINRELVKLYLPTRLAELQMVESYKNNEEVLFEVPITAFGGEKDDKVKVDEMAQWKKLTIGNFNLHTLSGDHLFLKEEQNQGQLLKLISQYLEIYK